MECMFGQMVEVYILINKNMKDFGLMENNMEKEDIYFPMEKVN